MKRWKFLIELKVGDTVRVKRSNNMYEVCTIVEPPSKDRVTAVMNMFGEYEVINTNYIKENV